MKTKHIIIVTGLSGAGKTTALNILEDMNYYTIDNLPLGLEKSLLDTEIEHLKIQKISLNLLTILKKLV